MGYKFIDLDYCSSSPILEFISNTESKWMHNWCAKNYQTDFAIYNQLLKFNTLFFNKFN